MHIALASPYHVSGQFGITRQLQNLSGYLEAEGHTVTLVAPGAAPLSALRRTSFDVVNVHEPGTRLFGPLSLLLANAEKSAIVTTSHTAARLDAKLRAYRLLAGGMFSRLMSKADERIAVTRASAAFLNYFSPGEYAVIPNSVDTAFFTPDAEPFHEYLDGRANVLFVGRYEEKNKGFTYLQEACASLPYVRLLVAGSGRRLPENTFPFGAVSAGDLRRLYATAHVVCVPSTHGESFGMVIAEAMASGKPVIASDIDAFRETLGRVGRRVPPADSVALASSLEALVEDRLLRETLGTAGRQRAEKFYSISAVGARTLALYERALMKR